MIFAFAISIVLIFSLLLWRYLRVLKDRINAESTFDWDVEVEKLHVGVISDKEYAQIRHLTYCDVGLYFDQIGNFIQAIFKLIAYCFMLIPIWIFWAFIFAALISPESITGLFGSSSDVSDTSLIHQSVIQLITIFGVSAISSWAIIRLFGMSKLGLANKFEETISDVVRLRCGVIAKGNVILYRFTEKGICENDEVSNLFHESFSCVGLAFRDY